MLLLDEPFGQIDNFKKNSLRRKLFSYLKEKNIACIVATHDKNDALSFADHLIIIKQNQILVNDSPIKIYDNPKSVYVASLFDDVNEIKNENSSILYYPHQIKIVDEKNSNSFNAKVTNSYFKGDSWLIEVDYNNQKIFLKHTSLLEKGKSVNIIF